MADTAARLALVARRYEVARFTIIVTGIDLTGVGMNMQVRLQRGTPGAPNIQLGTVTTTAAEGLKLDSVSVVNGVTVSIIRGRINQSTMSDAAKVPYAGEIGADHTMAYAMQWTLNGDANTRIEGDFIVRVGAYGSDAAPAGRPEGYGSSQRTASGGTGGTLKPGDKATRAQCAAWLQTELAQHMTEAVATTPTLPEMPSALRQAGDFHYNAGPGWWNRSPMRAHFLARRWRAGCEAFRHYVVLYKAPKVVRGGNCRRNSKGVLYCEAAGLVKRREDERARCLAGLSA